MPRNLSTLLAVVISGLWLSMSAWGQATTSLHGTVTDSSGAAIAQAKVILTNVATNFVRQTTSTTRGVYEFVSILPGTYALTVEAEGFRTYVQTDMQLLVDLPATADVRLKVGASTETIQVKSEASPLNTTDASLGHDLGSNEIENLPMEAEQLPLLLSLQPGVVYNGQNILTDSYDTRAGSVNGEHSDQNNITLDGVSVNDEFNGYAFQGVLPSTPYSVEEFRVTTSNYDATEGRSAGAQISMVTKGGTNAFHGVLYEYNRNTIGEANDYFLKLSQLQSMQPNLPQHLVRNLFGGALGGPILKNRLFFFFNYQGERQSYQESVLRNVPTTSLDDGVIQYQCSVASQCPGGSVMGASGASYPVQPGYYGLGYVGGQSALAQMDPLGIGPSSAMLNYFKMYPAPNDFTVGNEVNFAGYRFPGRQLISENWYIGRLDYKLTANGNHTLFFRGAARNDPSTNPPFLPGTPPESSTIDVSKGFVGGYTAVFGPRFVNNLRYGITHQSVASPGDTNQPWNVLQGIDQPIVYSTAFTAPVHNLADTATWQKGSHSFQFGTNILLIRRTSDNETSSFSSGLTNSNWMQYSGFANVNSPLNPDYGCTNTGPCFPAVNDGFEQAYNWPVMALMGMVSEVFSKYNYEITNPSAATPLSQGAPIARHWATDTYNIFFQDTWRALPNLALTYGLNYQLMTPITETNGQEVTPSVNMGDWFNQRAIDARQGIPSNKDASIFFQPAGSVYGRAGLYSAQKKNFAPRLGLAWTPHADSGWLHGLLGDDKTVIRAGAGMYFDNFGPALAMSYDATGTFGLSTTLENPVGTLTAGTAPRLTSINSIPTALVQPAPPSTFPVQYPVGAEAIGNGIDQSLRTPYSYAVDLSIQRQLPGRMTLDIAYVGHFAHHVLALDDVATPMDLVDPKSGIDYFSAAKQLSTLWRANTSESSINAATIGPTAQYWLNMLTPQSSYTLCSTGGATSSLLVATYDLFGPGCGNLYNETSALFLLDVYGFPTAPVTGTNSYFNSQYSSLWDWRSIAYSNYNALQIGLHKQFSNGVLFGLNYSYSKSLDIESEAERGVQYLTDSIINAWSPSEMYGPSDYDLRHQLNGYWVADLPFGRGREYSANVNSAADAVIGGWQLGGTIRWTSGFPASAYMALVWPTNWDEMGWADLTGQPIKMGTTLVNGTPNAFKNPQQAINGFTYAFPGESGVRNPLRGEGFFGLNMNLSKSWRIPRTEEQALQFRWSVFNVTNSARFDIYSMQDEVETSNTFGNYTQTLTSPREIEFALIYKF
ncbi:MAG: carboxypeptidase-like regulatory domain-containing protein [Terriglobales bacterium]